MAESFVYGKAVPEANFVGREKESKLLEQNFQNGINTILISPRRWGKTSLVNHVCRHIGDKENSDGGGLADATQRLLDINEMLFMQQVEPLSAYQMNFLRAIASGNHDGFSESSIREDFNLGSPSNIVRLRKALVDKDIIYIEMKKVYISDSVFELWFRKKFV